MKKVGLAVCQNALNYGSQLQTLATIKVIEELGYKTEIINYKKNMSPRIMGQTFLRLFNVSFVKNKIQKYKKNRVLQRDEQVYKNRQITKQKCVKFKIDNFKNISNPYIGWNKLKKSNDKYDIFLAGSDQLWLPNNLGSHFYTLEFVKNKPKIAYATSFGVSQIPWFQKIRTKKYLNEFNYLSTREIRGKEIVKELVDKDIPVVCDPTLLLNRVEWNSIIPEKNIINDKYIFCYFLGDNDEHRKVALKLKEETNLKIVFIPFLDNYAQGDKEFGDIQLFDVNSFDFFNLIKNAEYVLTDSFHGSVFSILNHKKFVTFNRFQANNKNSRNSRIDSLLSMVDLEDRRYKQNIYDTAKRDINYKQVDEKIDKFRKSSKQYLKNALKGE